MNRGIRILGLHFLIPAFEDLEETESNKVTIQFLIIIMCKLNSDLRIRV